MSGRVIIIVVGAGFTSYCIVTAVLTILGRNPATLHLTKFFLIGYAAITAVLIPFGISGVIGGVSRKKTLVRAFTTLQWWLATFILIGLNVFNIVLSKRGKGDFISRCQADLAKSQPETDFLNLCTARADDAEEATFIATCAQGGIMLFLGIVLLIVGMREYNNISLEEETKNLLEKANFKENVETDESRNLSPKTSNFNNASNSRNVNNVGGDDLGRRMTNVKRQPSKATTIDVDLERHQEQNLGLIRNLTDPTGRNQTDLNIPNSLYRNPALPRNIPPNRYPTNANDGPVNITRQPTIPTIGNANNGPVNRANLMRQPTIPTIGNANDGPVNRVNVTRQPTIGNANNGPVNRPNVMRQPTIGNANNGPINRPNVMRQPTIGNANDGPVNRVNVTRQPTIGNANDGPVNRANVARQPTIGNAYAPRNYVGNPQATYPPPQSPSTKQYMNPPQRSLSAPRSSLSTKQYINPPQRSFSTKQYINPPYPPPQMKIPPLPVANDNYSNEYNNYRPKQTKQTMPPYYMGMNQ